jgi:hypothetical protein
MRFYFFDHGDNVLMIEIDDVSGGGRLDQFAAVVNTVSLGPSWQNSRRAAPRAG